MRKVSEVLPERTTGPAATEKEPLPPKLTKAQWEMLERLATWGPGPADAQYAPGKVLLRLGLATKEVRRNKMRLHVFTITPAGMSALAAAREHSSPRQVERESSREDQ